jgi:ssDNA-binding Zn-finger/Zn-ribbon topoisomerase 1
METRPLADELPKDAPDEQCSHGVPMQLRTGRFGPFYTSTHECGETKPFARRVGVACPLDGGEILEKRSKKGKTFYGCANWPNCDWVSWNKPLVEPCPECGGLQVDMGRGRVRCLKHEGAPPRFAARERTNGTASANGTAETTRGGTATRNGAVKRATARKPAAKKPVAKKPAAKKPVAKKA